VKLLIALHHRFQPWIAPQWFSQRLRTDFPQLEVVQLPNYDRISEEIVDADLAIAWSLRGDQITAAKKLRWIHSTAAAVHALMTPELQTSDIVVTNARAVHGPVVAEHAMALVFAMAKRLLEAAKFQSQRHWAQQEICESVPRPRELKDATMVIVGFGSIGTSLAKLARALGMRVVGVREHLQKESELADAMYGFDDLNRALGEGDFVVLATPVTEKTSRLMNAERLEHLKSDAYLINVGRGILIDEEALQHALRANRFAGAALDVTAEEPLPPGSPLWTMENVFITPHTAGFAEKMWERHYARYAENLGRYLAGEPLLWTVDKNAGY
jgi:phosphoglycerate dehydrogenase-like enzyme